MQQTNHLLNYSYLAYGKLASIFGDSEGNKTNVEHIQD